MFTSDTPFFGVALDMFNVFVRWFSNFMDFMQMPFIDAISAPFEVTFVDIIYNDIVEWFSNSITVADKPLGEFSFISVIFGVGLTFIVVYTLIKWLLGVVTGS